MTGAPRLTAEEIDTAVAILNGWSSKLTWDLYLRAFAMELEHGHVYSKVALSKHDSIREAWERAKRRLKSEADHAGTRGHGTTAISTLRAMLDETRADLSDQRERNLELLKTFKRWQFNAERHGVSLAQLDAPISRPRTSKR